MINYFLSSDCCSSKFSNEKINNLDALQSYDDDDDNNNDIANNEALQQ